MSEPAPDFLCCELSQEMNEPLAGTAVTAAVWFMLEYTHPWGAKATSENELLPAVRQWLGDEVVARHGRLQFIRQFRPAADVITLFIGVNDEINPRLYEFHLGAYEDMFELDMAALINGDGRYHPHLVTGQRTFICTNGKRDKSCAVYGANLYRSLAQKQPHSVWMTTHLGGHRFAATLLTLPAGVCYGRVAPQEIDTFMTAVQQGDIWLEKYRGRTCYSAIVQTADYYYRQQTGRTKIDAFRLAQVTEIADGRWQVQFQSKDDHPVSVTLAAAEPLSLYVNSGNLTPKEIPQLKLVDIK